MRQRERSGNQRGARCQTGCESELLLGVGGQASPASSPSQPEPRETFIKPLLWTRPCAGSHVSFRGWEGWDLKVPDPEYGEVQETSVNPISLLSSTVSMRNLMAIPASFIFWKPSLSCLAWLLPWDLVRIWIRPKRAQSSQNKTVSQMEVPLE